ncbi:hypothetical protein [Candidatus Protochlamydia phocaeensis]|uniref:hypothetical protein n=1 Tax=Candidatus Protochlamydia phocaeensis TaxID=1414722 RepID=UPI000838AB5A|nr:hypothetical protein [Candidatus Protochlamydia phocaeensis]
MKIKFIHTDPSIPAPYFASREFYPLEETRSMGGREYRLVGVGEKHYALLSKRLWLLVRALIKLAASFGSAHEEAKADWRACWTGKRVAAFYTDAPGPGSILQISLPFSLPPREAGAINERESHSGNPLESGVGAEDRPHAETILPASQPEEKETRRQDPINDGEITPLNSLEAKTDSCPIDQTISISQPPSSESIDRDLAIQALEAAASHLESKRKELIKQCLATQKKVFQLEEAFLKSLIEAANFNKKYQAQIYRRPQDCDLTPLEYEQLNSAILSILNLSTYSEEGKTFAKILTPLLHQYQISFQDIAQALAKQKGCSSFEELIASHSSCPYISEKEALEAFLDIQEAKQKIEERDLSPLSFSFSYFEKENKKRECCQLMESTIEWAKKLLGFQKSQFELEKEVLKSTIQAANLNKRYQARLYGTPKTQALSPLEYDHLIFAIREIFDFEHSDIEALEKALAPLLREGEISLEKVGAALAHLQGLDALEELHKARRHYAFIKDGDIQNALALS